MLSLCSSTSERYRGVTRPAVYVPALQDCTKKVFFHFKGNKQFFNYIFFSFIEDASEILSVNFGTAGKISKIARKRSTRVPSFQMQEYSRWNDNDSGHPSSVHPHTGEMLVVKFLGSQICFSCSLGLYSLLCMALPNS